MKKIYYIMILLASLVTFWACETDHSQNPVYQQPDSFVLNNPPYAALTTDLQKSTSLALTTSQPDYGFTAVTTYAVQISLDNTWVDATEDVPATYAELPTTSTSAQLSADAVDLDKAIVKLAGWASADDLSGEPMTVYLRLKATVSAALTPVYSNAVTILVLPYYVELVAALPATYYLVGDCIGDGSWTNTTAAIGISLIPMSLVPNYEYSEANGTGEFVYTGYFPAGKGFKLIGVPGESTWAEQWGMTNGAFVHNDGGSGNITVATDGWYTVTLNSATNVLTIDPADITPTAYPAMQLVGSFEGWGSAPVNMTQTAGDNSHIWYADVTFDVDAASTDGCKFRTDDSWTYNWGGADFPYSISVAGGSNILFKAGTYRVVFDDLNQCYFFFSE